MRKLILLLTLIFLLYPLKGLFSEDELRSIDERISVIEGRLEFIRGKEMEFENITKELDRAKYTVLIRKERELKQKKEELRKELESLLEEKKDLLKELDELNDRKRALSY